MKKTVLYTILCLILLLTSNPLSQASFSSPSSLSSINFIFSVNQSTTLTLPKTELPVMIASCGQSPGPALLKVIFMRAKLTYPANPATTPPSNASSKPYILKELATADDLIQAKKSGQPVKSLIIVMGASLKGMGAAGISMDDELDRTTALIKEARNQNITIIGAHIEGMKRRAQGASVGDNTDEQSIDAVAPNSDLLIIHADGNEDGRFTQISKDKKIPMIEVKKNLDLVDELKKLFGQK